MRAAALILAVFSFVPFANMLFARRYAPWYPSVVVYWIAAGGAVVLTLAWLAQRRPAVVQRLHARLASAVVRVPDGAFVAGAALLAFAASATLFVVCFNRQPTDVDEAALLWHAKILLSGRLSLPLDSHPEFFGMDDMVTMGRWYSQFPIGAPAVLALGVASRAAWLLNPVLIALTVIALHGFVRRSFDVSTARMAAAMFAVAPFVLLMTASFASYVPAALLACLALTQLAAWVYADSPGALHRAAALLGLALGLELIVRPLDALALIMVAGAMQLLDLRRDGRRAASLVSQLLAGMLPVAVLLYANARTTGSPFRLGYDVLFGGAPQLGFHPDPYGAMHTPARGLAQVSKYLLELNMSLLSWPVPVFAIIVVGLARLRRATRWDWFLLAWLAVHCLLYSLYAFEGWFRGPRYLFAVVPAVIALAARALLAAADSMTAARRAAVVLMVPLCMAFTWLLVGTRYSIAGINIRQQSTPVIKRVDPTELVREMRLRHALVFVNQDWRNRTLSRLWDIGFPHGDAVRLLASAPVCALNLALDGESGRARRVAPANIAWIVDEADRIASRPQRSPECANEEARDNSGTASYTTFFPANEIDANGHVSGDVIYVLDLGAHNEVLRERFGDRTWYRFGPRSAGAPLAGALSLYQVAGAP